MAAASSSQPAPALAEEVQEVQAHLVIYRVGAQWLPNYGNIFKTNCGMRWDRKGSSGSGSSPTCCLSIQFAFSSASPGLFIFWCYFPGDTNKRNSKKEGCRKVRSSQKTTTNLSRLEEVGGDESPLGFLQQVK